MISILYDGRAGKEGSPWLAMKNAPIVLLAWPQFIFAR
jgi:hypothetical protein